MGMTPVKQGFTGQAEGEMGMTRRDKTGRINSEEGGQKPRRRAWFDSACGALTCVISFVSTMFPGILLLHSLSQQDLYCLLLHPR